ncbi:MAG: hypothetical protein ACD_28C00146G0003 [uncultured bacterium]|nr:MAG: hypothetical protein ACD_28C00146G0003 [uncultured bacterium]
MSTIFKGTGILSLGDLISRVFEVLRIIVITHFFSVEDFGLFSIATGTALMLSGFTLPSYGSVILQYFPHYQKKGAAHVGQFLSSSVLFSLVNGLLFTVLMAWGAHWIATGYFQKPELGALLFGASLLVLISPLVNNLSQFLLSDQSFMSVFQLRIAGAVTNLILVILFTELQWGLQGLIAAYVLAEGLKTALALWFLRPYLKWGRPRLEREVWKFWRPLIATSLFKGLTSNLPLLIIGRFLDAFSIGLYNTAERTLKLIFSFTDPYLDTLKVVSVRTYQESKSAFIQMLNQHNHYTAFVMSVLGGLSVAVAPLLFWMLYSPEYSAAIPYFWGLSLYIVLGTINASFPRVVFSVKNTNHYYFWGNVSFTLFLLGAMIIFIMDYGLWGLVLALFLSRIFMLAVNVGLCKRAENGFSISAVVFPSLLYLVLVGLAGIGWFLFEWSIPLMAMIGVGVYVTLSQWIGWVDVRILIPFVWNNLRTLIQNRSGAQK